MEQGREQAGKGSRCCKAGQRCLHEDSACSPAAFREVRESMGTWRHGAARALGLPMRHGHAHNGIQAVGHGHFGTTNQAVATRCLLPTQNSSTACAHAAKAYCSWYGAGATRKATFLQGAGGAGGKSPSPRHTRPASRVGPNKAGTALLPCPPVRHRHCVLRRDSRPPRPCTCALVVSCPSRRCTCGPLVSHLAKPPVSRM